MKRKILLVLIVLAVLIVPSGAAAAYYLWNMPLGAHLALPEEPAAYLASYPAAAQVQSQLEPSRKSPGKKIAQGTCDGKGSIAVQLLGLNQPASPRGTDAIRLLKVDYEAGTVTILAVPPELWVQTPDLRSEGIAEDMLTMVYLHALKVSPGSGREKVFQATHTFSKTMRDNFGYWPDSYVTLNQPAFEGMLDELGGIDVNVPVELDGTPQGFAHFLPGQQHFDGEQALDYVRLRWPANIENATEWDRLHRQDQVLKAILQALYNNWTKVPAVAAQFKDAVATDLSAKQINSLMCMIEAAGDEAVYLEITPEMIVVDGEGHQIPIAEQVVPVFEQLNRK
jgi:polyisoprenyl-teichoic acid--peptidoglycan teichoic acid transferase